MKKMHRLTTIIVLFICFSLLTIMTNAMSYANVNVSSQKNTNLGSSPLQSPIPTSTAVPTPTPTSAPKPTANPSPTPTPNPYVNNLCPINDGKWSTDNPYCSLCPTSTYGINTETSSTHNGSPTWRVDPVSSNWGCDHSPIHVNVGDHVIMSCWVKTGGSSSVAANGARIGMDWWTSTQGPNGWDRIGCANNYYEAQTGQLAQSHDLDANSFVSWGHDWVLIRWDFYVQPQYASDGYYWPAGTMVSAATGFELLPWVQVVSQSGFPNGAYSCYFSDFQFYVNP